jgi:hypothetical protein
MLNRRQFLKTVGAGSAALTLRPSELLGADRTTTPSYFSVHPFIDAHPDAVFIMQTNVDIKTNADAVKQAGLAFGQSVFVSADSSGIPISHRVAIKPNIVMMPAKLESYMGIVTDPCFVEGMIESLKLLGMGGEQIYLREVSGADQWPNSGYSQMAERTGVDLRRLDDPIGTIAEQDIQWVDVPEGHWFTRIPYLWPVNAPDTLLLNIAKMKTHLMGMSLCAKNLQGTNAVPYVTHCSSYSSNMEIPADGVVPGAKAAILNSYNQHVAKGIPRWDRPGEEGGIWQEIWATRCLDNNSVTRAGLNIIEAVYGREGPFSGGPGIDGKGIDRMMNMIIFGKNPFHVDTIGLWLSGHNPGNLGYLHMAIERGLSSILNPADIALYEWKSDGSAVLTPLTVFDRTPLRTEYLLRDYNDQQEDQWHLLDEPYDYSTNSVKHPAASLPQGFVLHQNFPNPFNSTTSVSFDIPKDGNVRIEILDVQGQVVDLLLDGSCPAGSHLVRWNADRHASGVYFCRMLYGRSSSVRSLVLIR